MRCDVLAVGTELLLGQIVDTNSSWIGEHLAEVGIDTYDHRKVGDNLDRVVVALRSMLDQADAVIVCGGLGPTQDDLTRDALAALMGVALERDAQVVEYIRSLFGSRGRDMPENNLRQADVPVGATVLPNPLGTAPGLRAQIDGTVVYAVPGVPYEMHEMVATHVLPELLERSGERAVIRSRSLKTWGTSESALAEMIEGRVDTQTNPTIAFLARGIEGLVVRLTAKATNDAEAAVLLDAEEAELRTILSDLVFAMDEETMESVVLEQLRARGWTLGVAESLTGGLVGARLASVAGASDVFRGTIATYATDVKRRVLGVTAGLAVSEQCAKEMAEAARDLLQADVGIAITGVAGPDEAEGQPVGTVWFAIALPDKPTMTMNTRLPGDRERIRAFSTISLLNLLRLSLDEPALAGGDTTTTGGRLPGGGIERAFVAIVPTDEVLDAIARCISGIPHNDWRVARRDQWHLTLQFLGRVGSAATLERVVGLELEKIPPFELQLGGAGAFPSADRATALWLGAGTGGPTVRVVAHRINAAFGPPDKPFEVHLTVARSKEERDARELVGALHEPLIGPPFTVSEVVLFSSETRPEGAVYTAVSRIPLGG